MILKEGTKYLVTLNHWFYDPEGRQVKAVYGTAKNIEYSQDGFIESATFGSLSIFFDQVITIIETNKCELGPIRDWAFVGTSEALIYERPSAIYNADQSESSAKLHVIKS